MVLDAQAAANLRRLQALEEKAKRSQGHDLGAEDEMDLDSMEAAPLFALELSHLHRVRTT